MFKQFKEFALGGSLVDMAVGLILGAAFSTVVMSLVDNVIMPPIGKLMGDIDFSQMFYNMTDPAQKSLAAAEEAGHATLKYGQFLQDSFSFLVIATVIFIVVKKLMSAKDAEEDSPSSEELLTEIRDLLAKK